MHIYLCSTIRHILFALTKGLNEPEVEHKILVSVDQQGISQENFDLSVLPANITFNFFSRQELKHYLRSSLFGKILWVLGQRNVETSHYLKSQIETKLFNSFLGLKLNLKQVNLFLFNDRNHIARVLRLGFDQYSSIEDGLSSYHSNKLNTYEKLIRSFQKNALKKRYFGDDPRCREIFFLDLEKAPQELRFKAKAIDWIDFEKVQQVCFPFFRLEATVAENIQPYIIATQPISHNGFVYSGKDLQVYQMIVDKLKEKGITPSFKVHPREPLEKFKKFEEQGLKMLPAKIPLELLLLGQKEKVKIYSINSSAGMGFEKFCERYYLIDDEDADRQGEVVKSWIGDISIIQNKINGMK